MQQISPEIFITYAMVDNLVNNLLLSVSAYNKLKGSVSDNINDYYNNANLLINRSTDVMVLV